MSGYGAPPGWYPDPSGQPRYRWWDGMQWTEHTGASAPQGADPSAPVRSENRLTPWAQAAVIAYALFAVVEAVTDLAFAARLRRLWDWYRAFLHNVGTPGYVAPRPPSLGAFWVVDLLSLVAVAAGVVFLVWQFRAATSARSLGYPARHSPGWGVGAWFVPVVNFWIPFQAVADCLPQGHPSRRGLWVIPVLLDGLGPVASVLVVVAAAVPLDRAVEVVALFALITAEAVAALKARRLVLAISSNHNRTLAAAP